MWIAFTVAWRAGSVPLICATPAHCQPQEFRTFPMGARLSDVAIWTRVLRKENINIFNILTLLLAACQSPGNR
jgi:hypothetical protein